jgi:hypothetical protein
MRLGTVTSRQRRNGKKSQISSRRMRENDCGQNRDTFGFRQRHRIPRTVARIRRQSARKFAHAAVPLRMHLAVHRSGNHAAGTFMTRGFLCARLRSIAKLSLATRSANRSRQKQQRQPAHRGNPANSERPRHERHKSRLRQPRERVNAQKFCRSFFTRFISEQRERWWGRRESNPRPRR